MTEQYPLGTAYHEAGHVPPWREANQCEHAKPIADSLRQTG